ncbi:HEAT repeat domain-containing protein [Phormidium sp. LEGE 05292]|uniref:phycobilisome degradation protein NblB n=1 Tax=[Phormidium] sp. LEGE 05292 TaxID=767427 RepID=UPI0018827204|nr:HEAT repeat domain-containing protein [Phormidium sp. LEGE 05292]MBE9228788.1 HEAT repeat domain-containing protein [Phormidium sp. LEGE 05292]
MTITPDSVQKLLRSEELSDRLRAVNQLRQLDRSNAFKLVQIPIKDSNSRVRYAAVSQLDILGWENLETSLQILRDRLLNDSEVDVQAAAADCLGALQLKETLTDLEQAYHNTSEWLLQMSIIAALGEMGDIQAFNLLEEALQSKVDLVKTAAISSFGELGDLRAVPLLSHYSKDPDWQTRYRVVQALSRLGSPEALAVLQTMTNDEVEQIAKEAKNSLPIA